MKRHLETCHAATELARAALEACADTMNAISAVLGDLVHLSQSLHLSLVSSPGWPEPSPEQTAALREAVARLSDQFARATLLFARLDERASSLDDL